jgi:hypothetical protein
MREVQESCTLCDESGNLVRVPQMPFIKKETENKDSKVGTLTNSAIEENKELLSSMKKEARSQIYDS